MRLDHYSTSLPFNAVPFVLNATVGNIIALCGSCFLSGPHSQMKKMWAETRRTATIAYLGSLFLTLLIAFIPNFPGPRGLLLLLLMLCQYVSITWYCLSYIPYAREAVLGFLQRRLGRLMDDA
jgi:Got1/Sft2-like family